MKNERIDGVSKSIGAGWDYFLLTDVVCSPFPTDEHKSYALSIAICDIVEETISKRLSYETFRHMVRPNYHGHILQSARAFFDYAAMDADHYLTHHEPDHEPPESICWPEAWPDHWRK